MNRAEPVHGPGGKLRGYLIFCPGCNGGHLFTTEPWTRDGKPGPVWTFNGDLERPTFTPSMNCNPDHPETRCHSFVTDGKIRFLVDCHHKLAGRVVELGSPG